MHEQRGGCAFKHIPGCPSRALITGCLNLHRLLWSPHLQSHHLLYAALRGTFLTGGVGWCSLPFIFPRITDLSVTEDECQPCTWQSGPFQFRPQPLHTSTLLAPSPLCSLLESCRHPVLSPSCFCICCSHYPRRLPSVLTLPAWKTSQLRSWLPGVHCSQGTSSHFT